jgi:hypothetical protein
LACWATTYLRRCIVRRREEIESRVFNWTKMPRGALLGPSSFFDWIGEELAVGLEVKTIGKTS